jgi:pimeloyl-ACP methyl ester carboxylesterase
MARKHPVSSRSQPKNDPLAQQQPLVSGKWLLWSLAGIFGGGLALVYLTSCLLFWQGQWQILFKPSHKESVGPSTAGVQFEHFGFAVTETGQHTLDGWFIPAGSEGRYAGMTILYLHSMRDGSLSDTVPEILSLHRLGINVFAFDYRGFGFSDFARPSESLATQDTDAAWEYLVDTRHVPAASILIFGTGLGASLAAEAAARHPDAAGVVLDSPTPTALELLRVDPRSHWMPVRLLAHDQFDPGPVLTTLKQPKLFLLPPDTSSTAKQDAKQASDPKLVVYLPASAGSAKSDALGRFLDELTQP